MPPCSGRGERGQTQEELFGGINECGCAIVINFSSGLKHNCSAGISALGSCLAVAARCFLAGDAQVIKAKVGCAVLWGENGKVRVSGVGLVQEQEDLEHPRGLACWCCL